MATVMQSSLVLAFAQAVTDLVTVEKKNIIALTEIARDTLQTEPQSAPSLAALISNRILQAPQAMLKLPVLYLLDSVSKLVGEPYKTLFAPTLPEVFMSTWQASPDPKLHRQLEKLLVTWVGVFPNPLLAEIQARLAALRAAAVPVHVQPAAPVLPAGGYGYAPTVPQFQGPAQPGGGAGYGVQQPGTGYGVQPVHAAPPYQQPPAAMPYPQQPAAMQPAGFGGFPGAMQPQPAYHQQQQLPYPAPAAQLPLPAQQQQQQLSVPDLLSSLMSAGLLAAPGAQPAAAAAPAQPVLHPSGGSSGQLATPPYASSAATTGTPERELPATTKFTPDHLKEPNPSAVARLLRVTEITKSRFLDSKFLRRQQRQAGSSARASRMWYLNLDTWMASTVGQAGAAAGGDGKVGGQSAGQQGAAAAAAAVALDPAKYSVPVDDLQTHCALSGEQFEQFWDEVHQEWRYRGAKALDADEAASYGLEEGAIVLVTALGAPAGAPGGGAGVLSELAAQREIADDLAAAAVAASGAAAAAGGVADGQLAATDVAGTAGGVEIKEEKLDLKHPLDEDAAAALAGAPGEKRQRVG